MTVARNAEKIARLEQSHAECQQERMRLSFAVEQLLAEDEDGWSKNAKLVMKAIGDLEAAQKAMNNRIWALLVGVLMALLGVVLSWIKSGGG